MKKIFSLFVTLLVTTCLWAYDFKSGDLYYKITSSTAPYTVEVTYQEPQPSENYPGLTTAIIPENVTNNGTTYSVTSIGHGAFMWCYQLNSITIPSSVLTIGSSAFYGASLDSIIIPNSVTSIGDGAFSGIEGGGASIRFVVIGENVATIGDEAFRCQSNIVSIKCLAENPPLLGSEVFSGYDGWKEGVSSETPIYVPCGSIDIYNSSSWNYFNNIQGPLAEYSIQVSASNGIMGTAQVDKNNGCGCNISATANYGYHFVQWSDGNTDNPRTITLTSDITLTAEFEEIPYYSVTISGNYIDGYVSIRDWYFHTESSAVQFEVQGGTEVYFHEISNCGLFLGWSDGVTERERTIVITSDTTIYSIIDVATYSVSITAGEGGYLENGNIEREYNECNRETIYTCAIANDGYYFAGWSDGNTNQCIDIYPETDINLIAQFVPNAQVTVLVGVDNTCKNMGSVSGSGIYYSGDYVTISATPNAGYHFVEWSDGNSNATRELYLQSDITLFATFAPSEYGGKCGENLYWTYSNNTITITGSGDMDLYEYPAWDNYYDWYYNVTAVQFPKGITSIDGYAFSGMSLTSVVVPASVTHFGEKAFAYNDNLTRFEHLGTDAEYEYDGNEEYSILYNSNNLVYFKGQKDMLSYVDSYAYLDTVIITSGEGLYELFYSNIKYIDNFNADDLVIEGVDYGYMYMNLVHTLILPEHLHEIGDFALTNARYLEQITIPAGVTRIGESAFEECRSLESVTFAGTALRDIDDWAFYNCHSLKKIDLPEGVTSIGKAAFFDCSYLKEITLPSTMQTIADNAFSQCQKVSKITVNATTPPVVEPKTFEDIDRNIPLYVPAGTASQYKQADYWCEFFNVIEQDALSSVENLNAPSSTTYTQKLLRNGQLIILRDGKTYTTMGAEIQ